jgi:hypothetical protein
MLLAIEAHDAIKFLDYYKPILRGRLLVDLFRATGYVSFEQSLQATEG